MCRQIFYKSIDKTQDYRYNETRVMKFPHRGRNYQENKQQPYLYVATHTPHRGRNFICLSPYDNLLQLTRPIGDETGLSSGIPLMQVSCNSHAP